MGFKQGGNNNTPAIFAKFNGARGVFDVEAQAGEPGATEYTVTKGPHAGEKRYRKSYNALEGRLVAVTTREDDYMGRKSLYVNLAFEDPIPGNPTIVATCRIMGGDNGAVVNSVLGFVEALNKVEDFSSVLDISIAHNPAGSKFIDKNGQEQTLEFGQSKFFVRLKGASPKDFIRDSREARPAVEDIKDKSGRTVSKDYSDLLAYAKDVINSLSAKVEAHRRQLKDLMANAHEKPPTIEEDDLVFGA